MNIKLVKRNSTNLWNILIVNIARIVLAQFYALAKILKDKLITPTDFTQYAKLKFIYYLFGCKM